MKQKSSVIKINSAFVPPTRTEFRFFYLTA